ncbi:hypothetical protein [Ekhidna lutea]|uniref:hypothetical protein n=1 Tax=Ekhidna lutea TaxID=447679 RepID=UPI00117FC07C|nr:hypothetical protein [Ekhidna lutea]
MKCLRRNAFYKSKSRKKEGGREMKFQNGQGSGRVPMLSQKALRHMADERLLYAFIFHKASLF